MVVTSVVVQSVVVLLQVISGAEEADEDESDDLLSVGVGTVEESLLVPLLVIVSDLVSEHEVLVVSGVLDVESVGLTSEEVSEKVGTVEEEDVFE